MSNTWCGRMAQRDTPTSSLPTKKKMSPRQRQSGGGGTYPISQHPAPQSRILHQEHEFRGDRHQSNKRRIVDKRPPGNDAKDRTTTTKSSAERLKSCLSPSPSIRPHPHRCRYPRSRPSSPPTSSRPRSMTQIPTGPRPPPSLAGAARRVSGGACSAARAKQEKKRTAKGKHTRRHTHAEREGVVRVGARSSDARGGFASIPPSAAHDTSLCRSALPIPRTG